MSSTFHSWQEALPANIRKLVVFFFQEIKRDGITSLHGIHVSDFLELGVCGILNIYHIQFVYFMTSDSS